MSCRCGQVRKYYLYDVVGGNGRLSCGCLKTGNKERERAMQYQKDQQATSDGFRLFISVCNTLHAEGQKIFTHIDDKADEEGDS